MREPQVRVGPSQAVVVGYDGSPASRAAANWAAACAEREGRPLRMVHVPSWPILRTATGAAVLMSVESIRAAAERLLVPACEAIQADHPDLNLDPAVVVGNAVPVLLREATDAALLVLGSTGLGELRDVVSGSVTAQLAIHAHCPVVVVPAGWATPADGVADVVVGVDGAPHSDAAIDFAFEYADTAGVGITAVLASDDGRAHDHAKVLSRSLTRQAVDHPDVKLTTKLVDASPTDALIAASAAAGLLVIGSRGGAAVHGLLCRSVTHSALHHARCPVAVVR